MISQTLSFNGIPYLVEYYSAEERYIKTASKFVMLRKYDIINDLAVDYEVCLFPLDKYVKALTYDKESKQFYQSNDICYPVDYDNSVYYTNDIQKLMDSARYSSLIYTEGKDREYYILRDKFGEPINIQCDEIRIYKPHNRNILPAVIDVSNMLNGVNFHYFCELYEHQPITIGAEKERNGTVYYEYISFFVPNLDFLFRNDNVYYYEDLNIIKFFKDDQIQYNTDGLVELNSLILPYSIDKPCLKNINCLECELFESCTFKDIKDIYIKNYVIDNILSEEYINSEYNYVHSPLVLSLSHYDSTDTISNVYFSNAGILQSSTQFINQHRFSLKSSIEFDPNNGSKLSFVTRFDYPTIYQNYFNVFVKINGEYIQIINKTYVVKKLQYYIRNNVGNKLVYEPIDNRLDYLNKAIYVNINGKYIMIESNDFFDEEFAYYKKEDNEYYKIDDIDEYLISQPIKKKMTLEEAYFFHNKISNKKEYYEFESYDDDIFLNDFDEDFIEALKFNTCGYMIELSRTNSFDGVFYRTSVAFSQESGIDDFAFSLNGIFMEWGEYPDIIFIRTMFIDKYLSKIIYGPSRILTKEYFKYLINETVSDFRLNVLTDLQTEIRSIHTKDMNIDINDMFFIDKINCSVKKHDITNENVVPVGTTGNSTIIYKTVFFKTQDSQNIKIRANVTQKIGINLGDYMAKVSAFILKLDGYEFTETERNDVYAIFTIPASKLSNAAGYYDIVNEDDEYITSGQYTVF